MPAEVIVGYTPDAGSTTTFAQAVEAWVAAIHIDPPRPWGTSADLDTKASTILASFADQTGWNSDYLDYLAGMLTPGEATTMPASAPMPTPGGRNPRHARRRSRTCANILNDGLRRR